MCVCACVRVRADGTVMPIIPASQGRNIHNRPDSQSEHVKTSKATMRCEERFYTSTAIPPIQPSRTPALPRLHVIHIHLPLMFL
jgi:hypothetical protein